MISCILCITKPLTALYSTVVKKQLAIWLSFAKLIIYYLIEIHNCLWLLNKIVDVFAFVVGLGQIISCVTSLCSISWALAAYQKALRLSLSNKAKLDWWCMVFLFIWRLLVIGPRVLAFAVFASCIQYGLFILCGIHWVMMLVWIRMQRTAFCYTKVQEYFFNVVAAFICIFDFFNLIEGHTRIRYLVYYLIVYCENVVMVTLWYFCGSEAAGWYHLPVIVCVAALFWVAVLVQIIYYLVFHPNNKPPYASESRIRICVPLSELESCSYDNPSKGGVAV